MSEVKKAEVHSIESLYNRLSDCYAKICNMRVKLQYLTEGEGEYPKDGDTEHPRVAVPSMRVTGEEAFNVEQQIDLCNKLVNSLKDGGHGN